MFRHHKVLISCDKPTCPVPVLKMCYKSAHMISEVLTAVTMKSTIFESVTLLLICLLGLLFNMNTDTVHFSQVSKLLGYTVSHLIKAVSSEYELL
jgi:hypothetical protein